jgi:hypothetical protein
MKCPKCHSDNPDTSRFCADSGTISASALSFGNFQIQKLKEAEDYEFRQKNYRRAISLYEERRFSAVRQAKSG